MVKNHIIFLTTGGTIEKTYDEYDGSLLNRKSIVEQMVLSRLRLPQTQIDLFHVLATDSLDMTDEDREILLLNIKKFQDFEEAHNSWMKKYFEMGWKYGEKYDPENRIHPDLVPYDDLDPKEKVKDEVFVRLVEIARDCIW